MYWACYNNETGITAIIYSATDPMDTNDLWDESYPYDNRQDAQGALDREVSQ